MTKREPHRQQKECRQVMRLFKELCRQKCRPIPLLPAQLVAPFTHGVYLIRDETDRVVHVGRTLRGKSGLDQRLRDHMVGRSSFMAWHLARDWTKLRGRYTFQCIEVADSRSRALVEALATGMLCPVHIGLGEKLSSV